MNHKQAVGALKYFARRGTTFCGMRSWATRTDYQNWKKNHHKLSTRCNADEVILVQFSVPSNKFPADVTNTAKNSKPEQSLESERNTEMNVYANHSRL